LEFGRLYSLGGVGVELDAKDVTIEEHLKLFVGGVDAQLLEAVVVEILKTVDVQDANCLYSRPDTQLSK